LLYVGLIGRLVVGGVELRLGALSSICYHSINQLRINDSTLIKGRLSMRTHSGPYRYRVRAGAATNSRPGDLVDPSRDGAR
jgi:hypothetical protein